MSSASWPTRCCALASPVRNLAGLSLAPEHRRGHGALYDAVGHGRIDIARLRRSLAGLPLPRAADGRLMLAVDVSNWLRPGAATSPDRLFCHVYGRGKGQAQMIPGWPYSVIAALEPGRTSWTAVLDAVRLGPGDDVAEVTAAQVRGVVTRLIDAGHQSEGDPPILVIFDAGYDPMRLACQPRRPARGDTGPAAQRPGTALPRAAAAARDTGPAPQARDGVRPRRPGHLAAAAGHHHDGDDPVRHRRGASLGPAAPAAHQLRVISGHPVRTSGVFSDTRVTLITGRTREADMDTAELNHLQEQITQLVRNRFPGSAVQEVRVLQYGDEPEIEPGQLLVQVVIEPPEGQRPDGTEADALIVSEFDHSQKEAIHGLRHDLRSVPQVAMIEFVLPGDGYPGRHPGPRTRISQAEIVLLQQPDAPLVPIMARLGPADLETVDTLITAGVAASRAEAVRWALARIRERPAYERLREHAQQIQELKAQF